MNMTDDEYRECWQNLGPIDVRMVERHEKCQHEVGDVFYYADPYHPPDGLKCHALIHVFELYLWRATLGFPSWEDDDRSIYRIHCPAKKGTVWEMRRVTE